jgi:hypothetical protein
MEVKKTTRAQITGTLCIIQNMLHVMCHMIAMMQKVVKVYSVRLESSSVQQATSIVVGWVKYHTVTSIGAVLPPSPRSTELDMPLQEDWRFSKFLTYRISRQLVQKAHELLQVTLF